MYQRSLVTVLERVCRVLRTLITVTGIAVLWIVLDFWLWNDWENGNGFVLLLKLAAFVVLVSTSVVYGVLRLIIYYQEKC